jgi:hypothetical protein
MADLYAGESLVWKVGMLSFRITAKRENDRDGALSSESLGLSQIRQSKWEFTFCRKDRTPIDARVAALTFLSQDARALKSNLAHCCSPVYVLVVFLHQLFLVSCSRFYLHLLRAQETLFFWDIFGGRKGA